MKDLSSYNYNILLIEDDPNDLFFIQKVVLRIWPGSTVQTVRSIAKGLELAVKEKFQLILLDLNVKDSYGPETVELVRAKVKDVPIIVTTGLAHDLTVNDCLKNGANNVVLKHQIMDNDFQEILKQNVKK